MNITISLEGFVPKQAGNSPVQLRQFDYMGEKTWKAVLSSVQGNLGQDIDGSKVIQVRVFLDESPNVCAQHVKDLPIGVFKKNPQTWQAGWHFTVSHGA